MNLYSAVATNCPDYVREKMHADRDMINTVDTFYRRPPLYYAIAHQDVRMFRLLLTFRPDLSIQDRFGLDCLDYARYYDQLYGSRYCRRLFEHDPEFYRTRREMKWDGPDVDKDKNREFWERMRQKWDDVEDRNGGSFAVRRCDTSDEDDEENVEAYGNI